MTIADLDNAGTVQLLKDQHRVLDEEIRHDAEVLNGCMLEIRTKKKKKLLLRTELLLLVAKPAVKNINLICRICYIAHTVKV